MIPGHWWSLLDQPLHGKNVILEPLQTAHHDALLALDDDPTVWPFLLTSPDFKHWFKESLADKKQKQRFSYAVRQTDTNKVVGSICYYEMNETHARCNIGYGWFHTNARGTTAFADCMLTLLTYGFEVLALNRIAFTTDVCNTRSQRAIEKIGAKREAVFRKYKMFEGQPHDLVYYSIIVDEWPKVKEGLEKRLAS